MSRLEDLYARYKLCYALAVLLNCKVHRERAEKLWRMYEQEIEGTLEN